MLIMSFIILPFVIVPFVIFPFIILVFPIVLFIIILPLLVCKLPLIIPSSITPFIKLKILAFLIITFEKFHFQ